MIGKILNITEADKTPLVEALLQKLKERDDLIERLYQENAQLKEEIKGLKDEIAELKKSPKRPKIKSSKKEEKKENKGAENLEKRPGSAKKVKTEGLEIHETKVIKPDNLPEGSVLKRIRHFVVQDLRIKTHNTKYVLEEWEDESGQIYSAQMPAGVSQGHFGNELCSFILDQHHQCQVTQPLLHEQLLEFGIDISTGQLNNILTEGKEQFHQEKAEILQTALQVSNYIQTDDTGARHDGKNGYCTQLGNEWFAWFCSTGSKSRVNFLQILNTAFPNCGYLLNEDAFTYMSNENLPQKQLTILKIAMQKQFVTREKWEEWLGRSSEFNKNHIKIATEGALLAGALAGGLKRELVILSDDAGQFNIPTLLHALCWIHEERHIKNLIPQTEENRENQKKVLDDFWKLYKKLKAYKNSPNPGLSAQIQADFDLLFKQKTGYGLLDEVLKRIYRKKSELLVVLERVEVPLHNNGAETDIREFVKRRKVSGGTRSEAGLQARDTFASLKKTCRKLGISFYSYLKDRLSGTYKIAKLSSIIEQAATSASGGKLAMG